MIERVYTVDSGYIDYDPSVPAFISAIKGYMPSDEFRPFMMKGLDLLTEQIAVHGKVAWIADIRKTEIYDQQDIEWTVMNWNTKVYAIGLRYMAMVMPESTFASVNVDEYMTEREKKSDTLIIKQFGDLETAKKWFLDVLAQ